MSVFTDFIKNRYTDNGVGLGSLDFNNIAKDLGAATALYGVINPNDSSGLANFFGTGGRQQPVGYTGGIPNYMASRELAPNAFAQTYTTPTGEVAPRRPGAAGRRYFTDTTFTQDTGTPFMGITAEQIAAQNQAAQDERDLFESILGNVETESAAAAQQAAAEQAAAQQAAAEQAAAQQAAAEQAAAQQAAAEQAAQTQSIFDTVDPSDGYSRAEADIVANLILEGKTGIEDVANQFEGVSEMDVIEGMLRGGYESPAAMAERLALTTPGLTETQLMASLLSQGRTTPEELAAYYGNNPDYPEYAGVTADDVRGFAKELGIEGYAQGGNVNGYYLGGTTDGMADQIPATIDNMQPAALSDGEFVIPADVVSHLGNGNSDAGAKNLYNMMDRVRTDRTGSPNQGRQIDPNKYLA
jgi:hypothetical protein